MKLILKLIITIALLPFTACGGGGDAPASTGSSAAESAPAITTQTLSADSEGVAIAMVTGSNQASGSMQSSSSSAKDVVPQGRDANASNQLLSRIAEKGRVLFQNEATSNATDKSIHVSQTATTITVMFDNEVASFNDGSITFNGPVTFTKTSSTTFSATANVSGQYANLMVSPTVRGRKLTEIINGTVTLNLNADYALIYNAAGTQLVRIDAVGDVGFAGSQIQFTGTVNGTVVSMSPSVHAIMSIYDTSFDYMATCSGSVAVSVDGATGVCTLLSTCDGCL